MQDIKEIFRELSSTSSRIEKENILGGHRDNEKFIKCLKFLLDPYITTGISKQKIKKKLNLNLATVIVDDIEELMDYIVDNNTGRDEDIIVIQKFISSNAEYKDLIEGLMTKSIRLGITAKTVNKVLGNVIREFNVMLAESYDKNTKRVKGEEFIISTKLDGIRCICIKEDDRVKFFTRQGQEIEGLEEIAKDVMTIPGEFVLDGELIAKGEFENSKEQFTQTMKLSRIKGLKTGLKLVCYDYIENIENFYNGIDSTPCKERKYQLEYLINMNPHHMENVAYLRELYIGNNIDAIEMYSKEAVSKGDEGVMVGIADAPYQCKRTKDLLKVKVFNEADVLVTDIIEGDGRNKGKLGAITIKFEHNGKYYDCNCGTGFSDSERELYFNNKELLLGKIVTIGYFEVSSNDDGGYGLRFPSWKNIIREDKSGIEDISMY